ncbi:MAG: hypothetical protein ABI770_10145 [Sphingomicrobium sp.]
MRAILPRQILLRHPHRKRAQPADQRPLHLGIARQPLALIARQLFHPSAPARIVAQRPVGADPRHPRLVLLQQLQRQHGVDHVGVGRLERPVDLDRLGGRLLEAHLDHLRLEPRIALLERPVPRLGEQSVAHPVVVHRGIPDLRLPRRFRRVRRRREPFQKQLLPVRGEPPAIPLAHLHNPIAPRLILTQILPHLVWRRGTVRRMVEGVCAVRHLIPSPRLQGGRDAARSASRERGRLPGSIILHCLISPFVLSEIEGRA